MLDRQKFEGNILGLLLDKYEISPTFINANFKWGSIDPDTGKWTGMVGNVRLVLSVKERFQIAKYTTYKISSQSVESWDRCDIACNTRCYWRRWPVTPGRQLHLI